MGYRYVKSASVTHVLESNTVHHRYVTKENNAKMNGIAALRVRIIGAALAVTEAMFVPRVAEGMSALTPFIARAVSDSAANPTEGGSYRNTEYTFF